MQSLATGQYTGAGSLSATLYCRRQWEEITHFIRRSSTAFAQSYTYFFLLWLCRGKIIFSWSQYLPNAKGLTSPGYTACNDLYGRSFIQNFFKATVYIFD